MFKLPDGVTLPTKIAEKLNRLKELQKELSDLQAETEKQLEELQESCQHDWQIVMEPDPGNPKNQVFKERRCKICGKIEPRKPGSRCQVCYQCNRLMPLGKEKEIICIAVVHECQDCGHIETQFIHFKEPQRS